MDFGETYGVPVNVTFDGQDYSLVQLTGRDYIDWLAEIKKTATDENLKLVDQMELAPDEKLVRRSNIQFRDYSPDDCRPKIWQMAGAERVVRKSFVRTITGKRWVAEDNSAEVSKALAVADGFLDTLSWNQLRPLAIRLSGIYAEHELAEIFNPKKDKPGPNG